MPKWFLSWRETYQPQGPKGNEENLVGEVEQLIVNGSGEIIIKVELSIFGCRRRAAAIYGGEAESYGRAVGALICLLYYIPSLWNLVFKQNSK